MESLRSKGKRTEIDSGTVKKIIRESAEMKIKNMLFVGGEPLVREDLFDLVAFARDLDFDVTIITNGTLLDKEAIERCFYSRVYCLNISIDAASEETLKRIRGEKVFETIIRNIATLSHLRYKRNSSLPRITATCTIMNDNLEELSSVISLCKELKVDRILFQPVVTSCINPRIRDFHSSVFIPPSRFALLDESIARLVDYKINNPDFILNEVEHLALIKKYFKRSLHSKNARPCYIGYNRLQISQDYVMSFCGGPNQEYEGSFGDVSRFGLKDLWYSKNARIMRKLIKKCDAPCLQGCSYRYDFIKLSELIKNFKNGYLCRYPNIQS